MITGVTIKGLRGIREGSLHDLTPLVVLVGPNGSGKSTILEAILIGAHRNPAEAVGEAVNRRDAFISPANSLLWKWGREGSGEVEIVEEGGTSRRYVLTANNMRQISIGGKEQNTGGRVWENGWNVSFGNDGRLQGYGGGTAPGSEKRSVLFVSPYLKEPGRPLSELFSALVRQGLRGEATALLGNLVPGLQQVEILTEENQPVLYLVFSDRAVPATLAGDGIHLLLRLGLQLATFPGGIALMEEPETHMHPAAIRQCARAIVAAVRRKIQIILSTHSLDLIDSLLSYLWEPADLELLSVYRVGLRDGLLLSSRLSGPDVSFARGTIMDDLR
jgi:predicted ATPase